ncbi:MAG: hypothetical protein QOE45_857 [Frankiaceae bacterium]|jgi:hypothetical protein|nr:hypothetical protein [Frankiaceae bacterium]
MRKLTLTAVAAGAIVASLASTPTASAALSDKGIDGLLCSAVTVSNPGAELGTQTGEVIAGPAVIDDGANLPGIHSGQFICTIQVGAANSTHAGTDTTRVTGPVTPGVIAAQGLVNFIAAPLDMVYMCTEVVIDGTHLYFNDPEDLLERGVFDTSSSVNCGLFNDRGDAVRVLTYARAHRR